MAITVTDADQYFATHVLHNEEWATADPDRKQRALNNAKNQLYRIYRNYNEETKPIPDAAIFEQALWLLRLDEALLKAPMGVKQITVGNLQIAIEDTGRYVCPEAKRILGRRIGRYA